MIIFILSLNIMGSALYNVYREIRMNPFNDAYTEKEIRFYNLSDYDKNGILVKTEELSGRCDDYFNKNFRTGEISVPILFIDKKLWMSLTPMEIQSHYLPIKRASGNVGIGGLGMGYSLLRIMAKPEVKKVTVYEIDQRVIDFFKENFLHRKGFSKVTFYNMDIRTVHSRVFDFFYMDIYQSMLPEEVVSDKLKFVDKNIIKEYHFWGQEKIFKDVVIENGFDDFIVPDVVDFIRMWLKTDKCRLQEHYIDVDFIVFVLESFRCKGYAKI